MGPVCIYIYIYIWISCARRRLERSEDKLLDARQRGIRYSPKDTGGEFGYMTYGLRLGRDSGRLAGMVRGRTRGAIHKDLRSLSCPCLCGQHTLGCLVGRSFSHDSLASYPAINFLCYARLYSTAKVFSTRWRNSIWSCRQRNGADQHCVTCSRQRRR